MSSLELPGDLSLWRWREVDDRGVGPESRDFAQNCPIQSNSVNNKKGKGKWILMSTFKRNTHQPLHDCR